MSDTSDNLKRLRPELRAGSAESASASTKCADIDAETPTPSAGLSQHRRDLSSGNPDADMLLYTMCQHLGDSTYRALLPSLLLTCYYWRLTVQNTVTQLSLGNITQVRNVWPAVRREASMNCRLRTNRRKRSAHACMQCMASMA